MSNEECDIITEAHPMEYNLSDCPMPPDGTDLSNVSLTKNQRLWLGLAILSKQFKTRELANTEKFSYVIGVLELGEFLVIKLGGRKFWMLKDWSI